MTEQPNETLVKVIAKALSLPRAEISDDTSQESTGNWNSMRHLLLVTQLESAFGISLTTQEVIALKSVVDIKSTLRAYGIKV